MKKIANTPKLSFIIGLTMIGLGFTACTSLIVLTCIFAWKAESTLFLIILTLCEIMFCVVATTIIREYKVTCKPRKVQEIDVYAPIINCGIFAGDEPMAFKLSGIGYFFTERECDKWIEGNQNLFTDEEKAGCVCTMQYIKQIEIKLL